MGSMEHSAARARLSALLDGALEPAETAQVEAHLTGCSACRAHLAELRATVRLLQGVEPVQVPEGFAAAVRGRIESLAHATPRPAWTRLRGALPPVRWSWKTAAAAASVALVAIFATNLARELASVRRSQPAPVGRVEPAAGRRGAFGEVGKSQDVREGTPPATSAPAAQPVAPGSDVTPLRRVIRTGHLAIEVEVFDAAARRILVIAESAGGFVADSSYIDDGGVPRGTFVVRVPAARFAEVVRQIEGLGTVQRRAIGGQDVTEEYIDLEARVRNLERQEARLLTFMDRATKIPDLMAIEQEVARVRGEIERLTGRLRFLANKVDLATIQAEVHQKPKKAPGGFWDIDRTIARIEAAFLNTVRQLLGAVEGLAAFAAALLPVVLLAVVGWVALRRSMRRADRPA